MRKTGGIALAATLLAGWAAPAAAWDNFENWNFCTGNALSVCMDFNLQRDGGTNNFMLTTTYLTASVGDDGVMTGVGLYRLPGAADLDVSALDVVTPGSWQVSTTGLEGGGNVLFEVYGTSGNGATDGVPVGGSVVITFTSTNLGTYAMTDLYARSHVQSVGEFSCSIKPDSRLDGNVVDGVAAVDGRCGGGGGNDNTVPEPISLVLLGSGLLGLGGLRRRRKNQ